MKKLLFETAVLLAALLITSTNAFAGEKLIYDFEGDNEEWIIPGWAYDRGDYISRTSSASVSKDIASSGDYSLKLEVEFPGEGWYAAIVETEGPFDWTPYSAFLCDVYLPEDAPHGVKARIAVTVGEDWLWLETYYTVMLKAGQWVTIRGNLEPGNEDWKRTKMVEQIGKDGKIHGYVQKQVRETMTDEFRANIQTVAIRVEVDRVEYKGAVYIDNMRLTE